MFDNYHIFCEPYFYQGLHRFAFQGLEYVIVELGYDSESDEIEHYADCVICAAEHADVRELDT